MKESKKLCLLGKEELVRINAGGKVSDAFWYAVGYLVGQQRRQSELPTGKLSHIM